MVRFGDAKDSLTKLVSAEPANPPPMEVQVTVPLLSELQE